MTVVAATKYVSVEDMAALADAGVEVVGENRAQDLEAKHAVYGDAFRWLGEVVMKRGDPARKSFTPKLDVLATLPVR